MRPLPAAAQAKTGGPKVGAGDKEALLRLVAPAGGAPGDSRILGEAVQRSQDIRQSDHSTDAPLHPGPPAGAAYHACDPRRRGLSVNGVSKNETLGSAWQALDAS